MVTNKFHRDYGWLMNSNEKIITLSNHNKQSKAFFRFVYGRAVDHDQAWTDKPSVKETQTWQTHALLLPFLGTPSIRTPEVNRLRIVWRLLIQLLLGFSPAFHSSLQIKSDFQKFEQQTFETRNSGSMHIARSILNTFSSKTIQDNIAAKFCVATYRFLIAPTFKTTHTWISWW